MPGECGPESSGISWEGQKRTRTCQGYDFRLESGDLSVGNGITFHVLRCTLYCSGVCVKVSRLSIISRPTHSPSRSLVQSHHYYKAIEASGPRNHGATYHAGWLPTYLPTYLPTHLPTLQYSFLVYSTASVVACHSSQLNHGSQRGNLEN